MLDSLRLRAAGKLSARLQDLVVQQAEKLLTKLLLSSVRLWRAEQYYRFDDRELCCSVRLFYFCDLVLRDKQSDWPLIHVEYDAVQPTKEMLLGDADPSSAPRPDFSILFGSARIRVEAKRLRPTDGFPALYVRRGMARFTEGRYRSTPPHPGVMVGYVEAGDPAAIVDQINLIVTNEPALGSSHALQPSSTQFESFVLSCESEHDDGLRLLHYEIDLQNV